MWIENAKEDPEKKNEDIETAIELIRERWKWRHFVQPHVSSVDGREQREDKQQQLKLAIVLPEEIVDRIK